MSSEETKALIPHCWGECFNRGNLAIVDAFVATTYRWHGPGQEVSGRDGIKQVITLFRTAFPDLHLTFEDQLAAGDKVASRWTMRGTHQGDLMGIGPTHKPMTMSGIVISRIVGGQIAEEWEHFDQLGMLPPPGQAGE